LGEHSLADISAMVHGNEDYPYVGRQLAGAGDLDGDGRTEVLVPFGRLSSRNGVLAYSRLEDTRGPRGATASLVLQDDDPYAMLEGVRADARGDMNGDGLDDLLVALTGWTRAVYLDDVGPCETGEPAYATFAAAKLLRGDPGGTIGPEAEPVATFHQERDSCHFQSNGLSYNMAMPGDVDGDALGDLLLATRTGLDETHDGPAVAWLFRSPVTGTLELNTDADAWIVGTSESDYNTAKITGAGDLDGDGLQDMLVTGPWQDEATAWLLSGETVGEVRFGASDAGISGIESIGGSLSAKGGRDLDQDGYADVLYRAKSEDGDGAAEDIYVVPGPIDGLLPHPEAHVLALVGGVGPDGRAGSHVASVGDMDGDGLPELAIGAPSGQDAYPGGAAVLLYGPLEGVVDLSTADAVFYSEDSGARAGYRVAGAGDVDGDGLGDLLIAARGDYVDDGAVYLVFGGLRP